MMRHCVHPALYRDLRIELPLAVWFSVTLLLAFGLPILGLEPWSLLVALFVASVAAAAARAYVGRVCYPDHVDEMAEAMRGFAERSRQIKRDLGAKGHSEP